MGRIRKRLSKRMTCKLKYRIKHKVAEHKRKLKRRSHNKEKKPVKDPGVPNSAPFKEDVLHDAEVHKQRKIDLRQAQKESRLKLQLENRGLSDLVKVATAKSRAYETSNKPEIIGDKDQIPKQKSYYKEFKNVVNSSDVILEVLDARDPLGCRCPQVEDLVISSGKRLVLVLNKIDLIPRDNLEAWLTHLRQELPTVAFKACTQSQGNKLCQKKVAAIHMNENLQSSKGCVGASFLMKVLGNYCRSNDIQVAITVGVVGFPNVGKSSIINSLKRARSCVVGATPGVTKSMQTVVLDKHIKIIDSPGVVLAKDGSPTTLALRNAVKVDTLTDVMAPAEAIVQRADHLQLCIHYCIPAFKSFDELLCSLAKRTGQFKKGGIPNPLMAAKKLINDWNSGKIKYYTHPPKDYQRPIHISAEYVAEMGKAFDISLMEEKMELDKIRNLLPSQVVPTISCPEPTEGIIDEPEEDLNLDDMSMKVNTSHDDTMETDDVHDFDGAVTLNAKKDTHTHTLEKNVLLPEHQQNKAMKNKFKKMRRRKKKLEKATASLSDKLDGFSLE